MAKSSFFGGTGISATNSTAIESSTAAAAASETAAAASATSAAASASSASANVAANATSAAASEASRQAAVSAKTSAETAETNAETAEAAALVSKNASAVSATASEASKVTSVSSAATATTKASEASTSETNAAASAATATSKASDSETARAASVVAKDASVVAKNESVVAKDASVVAKNASVAAQAAAETAETNAETAETNSASSATASANSATASANSATASESSKVTSVSSAAAASTSETNAATSETNAAASYDLFDDRMLGAKSSAPTVDNDGGTLVQGTLYFDTSSQTMKVYGSSGWVPAGSSVNGTSARFKFVATNNQTTFSGSDANSQTLGYDAGFLDVYLSGLRLVNGTDFTAATGTNIVLASGAATGDILEVVAYGTFVLANFDADKLDGQHGSYYTGYTDSAVSALVDSSPAALNTLNELAAALGDDVNFSTTVTNSIATKAPLASPTFTGTTTIPTADINAGTIDGAVIGGATPAAISGTTGTFSSTVRAVGTTLTSAPSATLAFTGTTSRLESRGADVSTRGAIELMQATSNGSSEIVALGFDAAGAATFNAGATFGSNVGIGTSSPNAVTNYTGLTLNNATYGGFIDIENNGTHTFRLLSNTTASYIGTIESDPLVFNTNGTERMRIDSAGVLTSKSHVITGIDNNAFEVKTNHSGNPSALRVAGSGSINGISGSFQNFFPLNVMKDSGAQNSIYAAGHIKTDGNIVINQAGKGVFFGGAAGASGMTSQLLDDYEEGTWTPSLVSSGATVTHASGYAPSGVYTKVGRLVTVNFYIPNFTLTGTTTNTLFIQALPFTQGNGYYNGGTLSAYYFNFTRSPFCAIRNYDGTRLGILSHANNSTWGWETAACAAGGANRYIAGSITYTAS